MVEELGAAPFGFKGAGFDVMRNPLRRFYGRGHLHFVTFSCHRRRPLLGSFKARDRFVKILDEVRSRYEFRLVGYVVLPEHVHLLLSEPASRNPPKVLQVLKQKVSRELLRKPAKQIPGQLVLEFGGKDAGEDSFWQRRFNDFNVWNAKKVQEKLEYMHANPVRRGLVEHPKDWPWSSWSQYALGKMGLIRIDTTESMDGSATGFEEEKSKPAPLNPKGAAPKTKAASGF